MSNMIGALPNNIIQIGPETGPATSNSLTGRDSSNLSTVRDFAADKSHDYRADSPMEVEGQSRADSNINMEVNEDKGENFQEVLKKKLSDEPKNEETSSGEKEETGEKNESGVEAGQEQKGSILPVLLNAQAQVATTELKMQKTKTELGFTNTKKGEGTSAETSGKQNELMQKMVSVSAQRAAELKSMPEQTAEHISKIVKEEVANTEVKNTQDGKAKTLTVQEGKAATAKTANENPAAVVVDPNPGNGKLIASNDRSALINQSQTSTQSKPTENIPIKDLNPATPQITEPPKAVVLNEKVNIDNNSPMTEQKPMLPEGIKLPQITENVNNSQTDSSSGKQTLVSGNDKQAGLNTNKASNQKTENSDIDISYEKASNGPNNSETAIKAGSELTAIGGPHNIRTSARVQNSAVNSSQASADNLIQGDNKGMSPSEQIIQNFRTNPAGPDRQININLNPPELGRVRITFQQKDGEIIGLLEVEKAQTRYDVEKSLPQIVASMQESGVQVKRINVVLDEQNEFSQNKNSSTSNFEEAEKQGFSGEPKDGKSDPGKQNPSESTLGSDYQQARKRVIDQISDEAISVYA